MGALITNMSAVRPQTGAKLYPSRTLLTVALLAIAATALFLRLWRLSAESAWWDEYTSLTHLGAPNLLTFLNLNRTLDPATLPLYYAFEYLWARGITDSVLGIRMLSILLGMLAIPLVYLLGRRLYGPTAGIVAAACLALSPIHAFHAQGIRMYVL
ncbi:MAG TPA: hypothetical protein ENN80_14020, partial [Candidatus Hydrogenedentes bacterium]|nr:hypothetical protein [Candidatus Hydrogenedentota bacterium]